MVTALAPLQTSATGSSRPKPDVRAAGEPHRRRLHHEDLRSVARRDVISEAVTTLLEPDQVHLRLPAATLAEAFLSLASVRKGTPPPTPGTTTGRADHRPSCTER